MSDPVAVGLHRVRYRLRAPHSAAHGVEHVRDLILVEVRFGDGIVGWGECSTLARPTYTAEHTAGAWGVLRDELAPALLDGREAGVVGHPMAHAGLRVAVLDARCRRLERSVVGDLAERWGLASPASAVERCAVIGRHDLLADLVGEVAEQVDRGVAMVKLKVTPSPTDLAAVGAVRSTWPDLALAVDFNGTATLDALLALERHDLVYVEQPASGDDLVGSAELAADIGCPIALDESVATAAQLASAARLGAGAVLNVKPARCGGLDEAVALAFAAREAGWRVFVGGMVESGVGRAAALAVAAQELTTLPTDLGPSAAYVDDDVTSPILTDDRGRVVVPAEPGIGRTPVPDRLAACSVDHVEVTSR